MQSATWVRLLRQVPVEHLQKLYIVTSAGTEISIQDLVRMDPEYLIIRGRLAGTSDAGRIFVVPLNQINYLGSQVEMRDDLVAVVFKKTAPSAALPEPELPVEELPPSAEPEPLAEEPAPEAPTEESPGDQPEEKPTSGTPPAVDRAELLQRIRSRQNNGPRSGSRSRR